MKMYLPASSFFRGGPQKWLNHFTLEIQNRGYIVTNNFYDDWDAALFTNRYPQNTTPKRNKGRIGFRVANGYDPNWFTKMGKKMEPVHHLANAEIAQGLQEADIVIYQSSWAKNTLEKLLGKNVKRRVIIHNGVNLELFNPGLNLETKYPILGTVGFFRYKFRLQTFFEASLLLKFPHKLLIIGRMDSESKLIIEKYSKVLPVSTHLDIYDFQSELNLPGLYQKMSILIHPVIGDVCPNVVCEALACGVPVVAPDVGGTKEIIGPGGIIFDSQLWNYDQTFSKNMADAIEEALRVQPVLSILARKQAEDHLGIEKMVNKYLDALDLPAFIKTKTNFKKDNRSTKKLAIKEKLLLPAQFRVGLAIRKISFFRQTRNKPVHKPRSRIAFTLFDFQIGGIESWLYRLSKYLRNEFDFYFLATKVESILPKYKTIGECAFLPDPLRMISYLQRHHIDIVQVHNERWPVDAALAAGIPHIIERLGGPRSWLRVPKYGLDMVIASSQMSANTIRNSIDSSKIRIIYNGIDLRAVDNSPVIRFYHEKTCILGRTSRFGHGQNLGLLVEALACLIEKYPQLRLVLVGSDSPLPGAQPVFDEIKSLVEHKQLQASVHFTGNEPEPIPFIKGFDIGTCVSNDEGIPNSLIEAMACRKPVISTDVGAIPELIADNHNGLLFPPGDIKKFISHIERLINDDDFVQELTISGRETIEEKFNIEKSAGQYRDLYHELLS